MQISKEGGPEKKGRRVALEKIQKTVASEEELAHHTKEKLRGGDTLVRGQSKIDQDWTAVSIKSPGM